MPPVRPWSASQMHNHKRASKRFIISTPKSAAPRITSTSWIRDVAPTGAASCSRGASLEREVFTDFTSAMSFMGNGTLSTSPTMNANARSLFHRPYGQAKLMLRSES